MHFMNGIYKMLTMWLTETKIYLWGSTNVLIFCWTVLWTNNLLTKYRCDLFYEWQQKWSMIWLTQSNLCQYLSIKLFLPNCPMPKCLLMKCLCNLFYERQQKIAHHWVNSNWKKCHLSTSTNTTMFAKEANVELSFDEMSLRLIFSAVLHKMKKATSCVAKKIFQ